MTWVLVDDSPDEAQSFADQLAKGDYRLAVEVLAPGIARERLLTKTVTPTGVLMDVDLANAPGERGSGPGIAQDMRVKQKAGEINEFPIVRFAARLPVQKNVNGDPGSDDLFDLKILKEEFAAGVASVQRRLIGLQEVYKGLSGCDYRAKDAPNRLLGLDDNDLSRWSHQGFHDRVLSALQVATHVAAGAFMRGFLTPTGLLLSEVVLSYRLGIDSGASGEGWVNLLKQVTCKYKGIGSEYFPRWWSRGLEDWWFDTIKCERALVSLTINERVETLRKSFGNLVPLRMPEGSAGDKPWRPCALSLEADPPGLVPVDPTEAVRITPRADSPAWTDPMYASLRLALQARDDFRINRVDLTRLQRKYGL
jgi:hypothetical protein